MSALEQFVSEQKKKAGSLVSSASVPSFDSLRNKVSTSISGFSFLSKGDDADKELLTDSFDGDAQLPSGKNRKNSGWFSNSDESFFGMSRTQRIFAFFVSLLGAIFCFSTAAFLIPLIVVSTRKFACLNTLGSILLLLSFSFLWGPKAYATHLVSPQKRLVTVCYFSSLFATLYSSLWLKSTIFTLVASLFQGFSLAWFVLSYVPGGERGLFFITSIFTSFIKKSPSTVLPI